MMAMSPASASPAPPPIAAPLIAVTTGLVSCEKTPCNFAVISARRSTRGALADDSAANSDKSAPAQKAGPAPVSTIARTPAAPSASRNASNSASLSARFSALRFSGRFMVRKRTAPSFWIKSSGIPFTAAINQSIELHAGLEHHRTPLGLLGEHIGGILLRRRRRRRGVEGVVLFFQVVAVERGDGGARS